MDALDWSPAAAKSWAGYISLYDGAYGEAARRAEERRWHREMVRRNPAAAEAFLVREAGKGRLRMVDYAARRAEREAWYEEQRHRARQALKIRLRADVGADATTGRNYRIWRRYQEGGVTYATLGKEFGISGSRAGQVVVRQRKIAPLRQEIWLEDRRNLGRPLDIDRQAEDYRGRWLP